MTRLIVALLFAAGILFTLISAQPAYAATVHAANGNGLVGYWSFNEGTSTIAHDLSGKGNSGTLSGASKPSWVSGKTGGGLTLDGSASYVKMVTGSTVTFADTTFTISFWEKETTSSGSTWILTNDAINGGWGIMSTGGVFLKDSLNSQSVYGVSANTTNVMKDGRWHHVVYVITTNTTTAASQNILMYIDGTLDGGSLTKTTVYGPNNDLFIGTRGASGAPSGSIWAGSIDEVRIYNRALSQSEITGLYWSGLAVVNTSSVNSAKASTLSSGLVGWWTMDGPDTLWTSGTTGNEADKSGSFNTATLNGMTRARSPVTGKIGQAFGYSNAGFLNAGSNSSLNVGTAFTYSIWIKRSGTSAGHWPEILWSGDTHVYYGIRSVNYGNDIVFEYATPPYDGVAGHYTNVNCGGAGNLADNTWTLFTVTYDGSNVICYKNGTFANSRTGDVINPSFSVVKILDGGFSGLIDDARIYNRALSATEVKQLYLQGGGVTINSSSQNLDNGSTVGTGLVGLWTFNGLDVADKVYDRSGSGYNGYFIGSATSSAKVAGKLGQALRFNGTNNYINVGAVSGPTGAVSVSAWVYKTADVAWAQIVDQYGSESLDCLGFGFDSTNGKKLQFMWNNTAPWTNKITGTSDIPTGRWVHVAVSSNGTTATFYVNGVADGSGSVGSPCTTGVLTLGADLPGGDEYLKGSLDDVRLYNRALTAAEIKQLYNMGR